MTAFTNAKYDASKLLDTYERELAALNERWPEIELWHDDFQKERQQQMEAWQERRDNDEKEQSDYLRAVDAKFRDEYFNMTKKWWQPARTIKELPPTPELSAPPFWADAFVNPAQTRLFLRLQELLTELQAGYQAAFLGSTLDATAEQMANVFAIAEGIKLDELLREFDEFNRARPDAGN